MEALLYFLVALLLAGVGVFVWRSPSGWMIAGYNRMPIEKKQTWNLPRLRHFVAGMLWAAGGWLLLFGGLVGMGQVSPQGAAAVCWPGFLLILLGGAGFVNLHPRFRRR